MQTRVDSIHWRGTIMCSIKTLADATDVNVRHETMRVVLYDIQGCLDNDIFACITSTTITVCIHATTLLL